METVLLKENHVVTTFKPNLNLLLTYFKVKKLLLSLLFELCLTSDKFMFVSLISLFLLDFFQYGLKQQEQVLIQFAKINTCFHK